MNGVRQRVRRAATAAAAIVAFSSVAVLTSAPALAAPATEQDHEVCSPPVGAHTSYSEDQYSKVNYRYCLRAHDRGDGTVELSLYYAFDSFYYWRFFWYQETTRVDFNGFVRFVQGNNQKIVPFYPTGDGAISGTTDEAVLPKAGHYLAQVQMVNKRCGYYDPGCYTGEASVSLDPVDIDLLLPESTP